MLSSSNSLSYSLASRLTSSSAVIPIVTTSTTGTLVVSSGTIYVTPTPGTVTSTVTSTISSIGVFSSSPQAVSSSPPASSSSSSSDLRGSYSSSAGVAYVGVTLTPPPFSTTVTTTTTTTSSSDSGAALSSTSTLISASFSSVVGQAFIGATLTPSPRSTPSQPAASLSSAPTDSVSRSSAVFTCPDDDGTYYTDQDGNGYQIQCSSSPGSRKRDLFKHGLYGLSMNREPVSRVPITSKHQVDFAACVNSCRTIATCVGTSYTAPSGICTYFSTFTSVGSDTSADVAFPADISCPSLNGFSYLDSSGSEYGVLCNQSYPASRNITAQAGYANLAACSNACSFSAKCLASSFVGGECTFISNLNTNTNPGQDLPGAVMLVLLQSRAVNVVSATGILSRSTSISVVRDLPSAVAGVQRGPNPHALVASDLPGCGDAFWQPNCAIVAVATSAVSSFSTVYTPMDAGPTGVGPVDTSNVLGGATVRPDSTPSNKKAPSVDCTSRLLGLIPLGC